MHSDNIVVYETWFVAHFIFLSLRRSLLLVPVVLIRHIFVALFVFLFVFFFFDFALLLLYNSFVACLCVLCVTCYVRF